MLKKISKTMLLAEIGTLGKHVDRRQTISERQAFLMLIGANEVCSERYLTDLTSRVDETEGLSNSDLRKIAKQLTK